MKILNIMLSRNLGGIQQSFLDYNNIIADAGFKPICVISKKAKIASKLKEVNYTLPNFFSFDPISKFLLRNIIIKEKPTYIIAHGKRAINFALSARRFTNDKVIIIGVAHNYWYKPLLKCDYIFTITEYLKNFLIHKGAKQDNIYLMPNSININSYNFSEKTKQSDSILRIGTLGRFVEKKGIDVFIKALSLIKKQGVKFEAKIGGEGEDKQKLENIIKDLDLNKEIIFTGWVNDKNEFFQNIDVFCLPSLEEPFGIIILEAALSKTPIIATKSEGPREILTHNKDALLVDVNSPQQIAESIISLNQNKKAARSLAESAFLRVVENYDIKVAAERLKQIIKNINHNVI